MYTFVKNHHAAHFRSLHFILCKLQRTLDKALIDSIFFLISMIGNTPPEWFQATRVSPAQSWEGICRVGSRATIASPRTPPLLIPSLSWFWKQNPGALKDHDTQLSSARLAKPVLTTQRAGKVLSSSQVSTATAAVNAQDPAAHPRVCAPRKRGQTSPGGVC